MRLRVFQAVAAAMSLLLAISACSKTEIVEKEVIKTVTDTGTDGYEVLNVLHPFL